MWFDTTYPLSNRTSSWALSLFARVHHLLNPDGIPFLPIPTQEERQFSSSSLAFGVWSQNGFSSNQIALMPDFKAPTQQASGLNLNTRWSLVVLCVRALMATKSTSKNKHRQKLTGQMLCIVSCSLTCSVKSCTWTHRKERTWEPLDCQYGYVLCTCIHNSKNIKKTHKICLHFHAVNLFKLSYAQHEYRKIVKLLIYNHMVADKGQLVPIVPHCKNYGQHMATQ